MTTRLAVLASESTGSDCDNANAHIKLAGLLLDLGSKLLNLNVEKHVQRGSSQQDKVMKNDHSGAANNNSNHRNLYHQVARHWHEELVNADVSNEWLTQQGGASPAIVRKLILELKQKSEVCHELLRTRLTDLNLALKEDEAFHEVDRGIQPYGSMAKLEELYTSNAILAGRSEELIATMRGVQDDRTASLLARMRNIQLERHQLYARFFQTGHVAYEVLKGNMSGLHGEN